MIFYWITEWLLDLYVKVKLKGEVSAVSNMWPLAYELWHPVSSFVQHLMDLWAWKQIDTHYEFIWNSFLCRYGITDWYCILIFMPKKALSSCPSSQYLLAIKWFGGFMLDECLCSAVLGSVCEWSLAVMIFDFVMQVWTSWCSLPFWLWFNLFLLSLLWVLFVACSMVCCLVVWLT